MSIVIEAPKEVYSVESAHNIKLFLAGGITNCPDWQSNLVIFLRTHTLPDDLTVYNPRQANFPIGDPDASYEQILWEYERLHNASIISFWFCAETL